MKQLNIDLLNFDQLFQGNAFNVALKKCYNRWLPTLTIQVKDGLPELAHLILVPASSSDALSPVLSPANAPSPNTVTNGVSKLLVSSSLSLTLRLHLLILIFILNLLFILVVPIRFSFRGHFYIELKNKYLGEDSGR